MGMRLHLLPARLYVLRLPAGASVPAGLRAVSTFYAETRTPTEVSVVTDASVPEPRPEKREGPFRALAVEGPLAFGLVGVLAALATPLAAAGVSIFVISTFDTDYVLVRSGQLQEALTALSAAGHHVQAPRDDPRA